MSELNEMLKIAEKAAVAAGKHALKKRDTDLSVSRKSGFNDLVTDADKECEALIIRMVKRKFPRHSILAEESGSSGSRESYTWVIDPIDGTTNFSHGFPFFCTSIAVMAGGNVKIGVVYDPSRKELFSAVTGKGAYLNGKRIKVTNIPEINDALVSTGFSYDIKRKLLNIPYLKRMLAHAQAVRRPGAAALDICYVACGRFDGFWEFDLNPWDTAAGCLILEEAGGKISTFDGGKFNIFKKEILVSNGRIHKKMMDILKGKK
jgi:myo-inositol-1(or 4)-monophosphatase